MYVTVSFGLLMFPLTTLGVPLYRVIDLGDFSGGGDVSVPTALNDTGKVVGWSAARCGLDPSCGHGFIWDMASGMLELPAPTGATGPWFPHDINESGQVVGTAQLIPGDPFRAVHWASPISSPTVLPTLPGYNDTAIANAINDSGVVVGYLTNWVGAPIGGVEQGFQWTPSVGISPVGNPTNFANDINNNGVIVGSYKSNPMAIAPTQPYLWDPLLGGRSLSAAGGSAQAINDLGQVVGMVAGSGIVLWDSDGTMIELGYLPGTDPNRGTGARDINNLGQVVGSMTGHAFLWSIDLGLADLNDLLAPGSGWFLDSAIAINNLGEIVGTGFNGIASHGFMLTPCLNANDCVHIPDPAPEPRPPDNIPEPTTLILFGLGMAGLAVSHIRRRNA